MQVESRNQTVPELVEGPSLGYAEAQPEIMNEANKVASQRFCDFAIQRERSEQTNDSSINPSEARTTKTTKQP